MVTACVTICLAVYVQDSPLSLQLQLRRTMAELTVWQKQEANGTPLDSQDLSTSKLYLQVGTGELVGGLCSPAIKMTTFSSPKPVLSQSDMVTEADIHQQVCVIYSCAALHLSVCNILMCSCQSQCV